MFCDFPKYRQVKSTIYRGVGGGGDATSDVELNALITLSTTATDAAIAAQAAQSAATAQAGIATTQAGNASASASAAAASASLAQALAGTAPSQTGNAGKYLTTDGTATSWGVVTSNPGTVTSVAATVPSFLSVAGSPITSSGTLAISLSGTALPVANGGTGATTATTAFNALVPSQAANSGKYLTTNGTDTSWVAVASPVVSDKIQSITATTALTALTITIAPTVLDFRSTTLSSGAISTVTLASAASVVVPTLATLGTLSGVSSRLAVLAINNAGTIEAAVVNIAGGRDLSETGLISTTAISSSATANNVIYSTTARTSVAYRVVGYVESTQATAGTWATAPSTVQGQGGLVVPGSLIKSGTAVASTSGTSIDFTSIPSWVKRITVMFNGVSPSGAGYFGLLQVGSGSVASSGYVSTMFTASASNTLTSFTAGFGFYNLSAASDTINGTIVLTTLGSNAWVASGTLTQSGTTRAITTAGNITLGGTLDRVRITTSNGTDTFDAGSVNILFE
jgi:hypothetical protein